MKLACAISGALLLGLACDSSHQNASVDTAPLWSGDADTSAAGEDATGAADAGPVADAGTAADPGTDANADAAPGVDAGAIADASGDIAPITYRFPAEVLVKGCAKALACSATGQIVNEGITHCAEVVKTFLHSAFHNVFEVHNT